MPKARQKISQLPSSHRNFVSYIHSDDVTSPSTKCREEKRDSGNNMIGGCKTRVCMAILWYRVGSNQKAAAAITTMTDGADED